MKKLMVALMALAMAGCATHANIEMPAVSQVYDTAYEDKSISHEVFYSQPKPGIFTGGEQLPMTPLEEAELSVASASVLRDLPNYIYEQLPASVKRANPGEGDYNLMVELTARDKKGPAYADYEAGKSIGKNLLTLGFGPSEYDIIADFDVAYQLMKGSETVFEKSYTVEESVDHEKGDLESYNSLNEFTGQMLEKHLILTLNDFFQEAASNL
ncbi:MAG: hypothetical protein HLX50_02645 [Alteromonadaceae bacterium]|nr:hypothetical protein [Alteromonadaceae bacterium]